MKPTENHFQYRLWTTFGRLIERRYRRYLRFSPAMIADNMGQDFVITKNQDLILPLFKQNEFLGAIKITKGGTLPQEDIQHIHSLFVRIGSVLLDASASLEQLQQTATAQSDSFSHDINASSQSTGKNEEVSPRKFSVNLVGGGYESRHRMAVQIHESLQSWSLLPWADAPMAQWQTEDMKNLAGVCLYIRDIFELTPTEQHQLSTLAQLPPSHRPHLLIGSYRPLPDYVQEMTLGDAIVGPLTDISVFVDEMPKESLRLQEVLEMLFEGGTLTPQESL